MTDDLIKRVAERLGWEYCPGSFKRWPDGSKSPFDWKDPEGIARSSDYADKQMLWLTSVDAALSIIEKYDFQLESLGEWHKASLFDKESGQIIQVGTIAESLPRAILLAFLEAPHD